MVFLSRFVTLQLVFRIRIRIDLALLEPDPYWDPDPGARKSTKITKNMSFNTALPT